MSHVARSYCRICAPNCGVLVTVDGDTVTSVRGDPDHPVSRGYVCPKGRALGDLHHDPRRLDRPLLRIGGQLQPVSWDEVLDDLARCIGAIVEEAGANAIGSYQGTPSFAETAGSPTAARFFHKLGTRSRYSTLTVDIASKLTATAMVFGTGLMPIVDVERTTFLLVVGTNPVVSHGQYNGFSDPVQRLRDIASRGEVWVVDPRRSETAHHATHHLPIRPGTDHALLAHLVRAVLERGVATEVLARLEGVEELATAVAPWDVARTSEETGLEPGTLATLVGSIERFGRISVLTGTGVTMARSACATEWLGWALLLLTDSLDRPGGMWCNPGHLNRLDHQQSSFALVGTDDRHPGPASRPDLPRFQSEHPCAALADEIEAGNVRALVSFGGNPLVAVAEPDRLRRAIASLDAFVVIGVLSDEQIDVATHVLPCTGMLERPDVTALNQTAQLAVVAQYTPAVVVAGADRRAAWWIFAELGRRLGISALPGGLDADTATDDDVLAFLAGGADAFAALVGHDGALLGAAEPVTDWALDRLPRPPDLAPAPLVDDLAQLRAASTVDGLRLIPRRLLRRFNSVHSLNGRQDEQEIVLNPADAEAAGVVDGGLVRVRSAHGDLVGPAVLDDGMRRGAVAASHAFSEMHTSRLVSTKDVNPLSGMITQTAVVVEIATDDDHPPTTIPSSH